jgi:hypothetical protein
VSRRFVDRVPGEYMMAKGYPVFTHHDTDGDLAPVKAPIAAVCTASAQTGKRTEKWLRLTVAED